jgi:DNA polymerase-3 subunit delta'
MRNPRENVKLFGHQKERDFFLNAFHSPRFAHAWILGGAYGIGKATFAFHMARYILSGRQDGNTTFSEDDPLCRRMGAQSHGDLWVVGEEGESEIGVEPIREVNAFLNQTSATGGWRVVIVDGADKLNRNAANALLKRLEEPPLKTVFLLITATSGLLLPTIRSRCQLLALNPLTEGEAAEVLQSQGAAVPDFSAVLQGSPGRLMRLIEGEGPQIYADLQRVLAGDAAASFIHAHGGTDGSYAMIEHFLRNFLYKSLMEKIAGRSSFFKEVSLGNVLNMYEKVEELFTQCQFAQLDKRATLTCVFAQLRNGNE